MKTTNPIISFITSILFLKEYDYSEEKTRKIKKRFPYFLAIWVLLILEFLFGLHGNYDFVKDIPENTRIQLEFIFFLVFAIYHWFFLLQISRFAKRHTAYWILLIPAILALVWNVCLWNAPTYNGAMDGFANLITAQMQLLILIILPTFLFALRMVKIENKGKGILLLSITTISAVLGIKQCVGKEGYLSDGKQVKPLCF